MSSIRPPSQRATRRCRGRIAIQHQVRGCMCGLHQVFILHEVREAQQRHAALARAEVLGLAAQQHVLVRDAEAVGVLVDLEPRPRAVRERMLVEQDVHALVGTASDPPAQLVQLREPEPLGVLDDHQRCVRYVDADLDHRRRDEELDAAGLERFHHRRLLGLRQPAVHEPDGEPGQLGREARMQLRARSSARALPTPRSAGTPSTPGGPRRTRRGCAAPLRRAGCRRRAW